MYVESFSHGKRMDKDTHFCLGFRSLQQQLSQKCLDHLDVSCNCDYFRSLPKIIKNNDEKRYKRFLMESNRAIRAMKALFYRHRGLFF